MALFLRIHPSGREYRLPSEEEPGEVAKALAEVMGSRACLVVGYELPDQPRSNPVVVLNGNVVECAELVELPDESPGDRR